jgi:hypothetical protein
VQRRLRRSPIGWAWNRLPQGTRSRLFIRFDHWNVRRGSAPAGADADGPRWSVATETRLRAHYAADEGLLAARWGLELPWREEIPPGR